MNRLEFSELPDSFVTTRGQLHQVAFFAVSPARYKAAGRMGLRHRAGGFGTPEFQGKTVRVEGNLLVVSEEDMVSSQTISTVRDAIEFLGHEYEAEWFEGFHDPLPPIDPDLPLEIDAEATRALGDWFAYAWVILEELQSHGRRDDDVSEVQLWPEHFDAATELGNLEKGQRASYGASPGDANHPEPYLYVSPWSEIDAANPYWNDETFNGASLTYSRLAEAQDPVSAGVDFLLEGYRILHEI